MKYVNRWIVRVKVAFPLISLSAILVLTACRSEPQPQATTTIPQAIATNLATTATPPQATATNLPATATLLPATASLEIPSIPFQLSETGQYQSDRLTGMKFVDTSRDGRQVAITIYYPARDGKPDDRGAPYPLILSSTKVASIFASHLVSYGFVVVGINKIDYYVPWDQNLIDQPLDILFALDQVASNPPEGLEGMIDADHAGAMGYSFDGYNSLAMSGARVNPSYFLERCASAPMMQPPVSEFWINYYCTIAGDWDGFVVHAGESLTTNDDGLWQPMTDERIRAVMPMAPEGAWLFGERGLAAVNRPTLIIGATKDQDSPYDTEAVYIFEHLGISEGYLISFVGQGHMMIYDADQVARMKHFAVAFFGNYLQGRADYAQYFSEGFVTQQEDLAWGVYK